MELVQIFTVFLLLVATITLIVISIKLTDLLAENRSLRLAVQNIEADELFQQGHQNQQARQTQQQRQEEILLLLQDIAKHMSQRQTAEPQRSSSVEKTSTASATATLSRISNR